MGKLIIEGDDKQLEVIVNRSRFQAKKHGLKVSFERSEKEEKPKSENSSGNVDPNFWKNVIKRVEATETLEGLEEFKLDERKSVVKAVGIRTEELTQDAD